MRLRVIVLTSIVSLSLASCDHGLREGHQGERLTGALRVQILPVHGVGPEVLTGCSCPFNGNPMIYIRFVATNLSDEVIQVGSCTAEAFDASGRHLFTPQPRYLRFHTWLSPDETIGEPAYGPYDMGWTAPDDVTLAEVRAVDHYDAACRQFHWIGPLPEYGDD